MYTREVTDTKMIDDDATLYESTDDSEMLYDDYSDEGEMDEYETLYDDYSDEGEMDEYETLYDDYWDEDETDYYSNDYEPTTSGTLYTPTTRKYEMPLSMKTGFMFSIFAVLLLVVVFGLRCIEKGNKIAKAMAAIGLMTGVVAAVFQLLAVWQVFSLVESTGLYSSGLSVMGKIMVALSITAIAAIIGALIMRIKDTEKLVKVLKSVAIGCGFGFWLWEMVVVFSGDPNLFNKMLSVAIVLLSCCEVSWVVAFILSRFGRDEKPNNAKTEAHDVKEEVIVQETTVQEMPSAQSELQSEPEPEFKPESEPEPEFKPEPQFESNSKSEPEPEFKSEPEPVLDQAIGIQETVIEETPVQSQQGEDVTVTDSFADE